MSGTATVERDGGPRCCPAEAPRPGAVGEPLDPVRARSELDLTGEPTRSFRTHCFSSYRGDDSRTHSATETGSTVRLTVAVIAASSASRSTSSRSCPAKAARIRSAS